MRKGKARDGSAAQPVDSTSFRREFTRLEREYVLARSILAARHATGMTKRDFAKAVGTSKGKVSRWERAETIPRLEMLQRIANASGISFQIVIVPLDPSEKSGARDGAVQTSTGRKRTTRKSGKKSSARTPRRSTATKSSARKGSTSRSTTTRQSRRKDATRKSSSGGATQT